MIMKRGGEHGGMVVCGARGGEGLEEDTLRSDEMPNG